MNNRTPGKRLEIRPQKLLWRYVLFSHLGGLMVLSLSAAPPEVFFAVAVPVLLGMIWTHRRYFNACDRITALVFNPGSRCYLVQADAVVLSADLKQDSLVTDWLTILHFKTSGGNRSVILSKDSVETEDYRRLRVSLIALSQT